MTNYGQPIGWRAYNFGDLHGLRAPSMCHGFWNSAQADGNQQRGRGRQYRVEGAVSEPLPPPEGEFDKAPRHEGERKTERREAGHQHLARLFQSPDTGESEERLMNQIQ